MDAKRTGLGIIFHSGSYDRLYHGLSLALAALALGREVKLFFSYWALEYLKRDEVTLFKLDEEGQAQKVLLEKHIAQGHIQKLPEIIKQAKDLGARFYACTNSMGLLNITRDELIDAVDKSMGITTFLTETSSDQILFI